jgi:hypothetical protein
MWQLFYIRARELALERTREAERERLARHRVRVERGRPWLDDVRRAGSLAADRLRGRRPAPAA